MQILAYVDETPRAAIPAARRKREEGMRFAAPVTRCLCQLPTCVCGSERVCFGSEFPGCEDISQSRWDF